MTTPGNAPSRPDHRGGCQCGAVRYRTWASPLWSAVCDGDISRRASGAPLVALFAMPDPAFGWEAARPRWFSPAPGISCGFCERCGTSLALKTTRFVGETWLHTATLDDPDALPPTERLPGGEGAPDWTDALCSLPRVAHHPSAR